LGEDHEKVERMKGMVKWCRHAAIISSFGLVGEIGWSEGQNVKYLTKCLVDKK